MILAQRSVGVVNGSYANSFILTHVRSVGSINMYDTSKVLVEALVNKTIDVGIDTTTTLSYFGKYSLEDMPSARSSFSKSRRCVCLF